MHERVCIECGAAFMPRSGSQVCCSDECKAARKKMLDAKSSRARRADKNNYLSNDLRNFRNALEKTAPVSVEIIMKARKKPAGVSDVRWRIELRRRANKKRYSNGIFMAPSPDLLR
jgi:hypothetical protein